MRTWKENIISMKTERILRGDSMDRQQWKLEYKKQSILYHFTLHKTSIQQWLYKALYPIHFFIKYYWVEAIYMSLIIITILTQRHKEYFVFHAVSMTGFIFCLIYSLVKLHGNISYLKVMSWLLQERTLSGEKW